MLGVGLHQLVVEHGRRDGQYSASCENLYGGRKIVRQANSFELDCISKRNIQGAEFIKREYKGCGGSSNLSIAMMPPSQHVENLGADLALP